MALVTLGATLSVVCGLDHRVKRLSQMNINLGKLLMVFLLILGPSLLILDGFVQNIGAYLEDFLYTSFWTESYRDSTWQNSWSDFTGPGGYPGPPSWACSSPGSPRGERFGSSS